MHSQPTDGEGMARQLVPMREPTYFVLASLLDGPLHGYAIIKRAEELSSGRIRLATGTLYTALDRLTAEGNVEFVREEVVDGRIRRYYALTDAGSVALTAEAERMAAAARLVTGQRPGAGRLATRKPRTA
jgi:PadR family transcriptional regulator, regulatory protein PadR